ncbi:DUF2867 domain-containing protein [Dyella marensis]|uniref:DUF2867 domain-containing protein n=1 Tax=Dyella marensis TaxID=500610 RepID=A0A1I2HB23_9GAMM|nr:MULTISPECIES: DUF2867 domain-containing protein [Dyella]SFF26719.1 Protein of unknown function [Dyella marensis]
MANQTRSTGSFPHAAIPSPHGGLPVEVTLIAQLGHGVGDQMHAGASALQRAHPAFIDALDEPSTRLGGTDLAKGDATALYTFAVGAKGHPFHRHAGHRVFTAVSGSSGAQLRFSTATVAQLADDPAHFARHLHYVNIAPDCLFTVRFNGATWHQFAPLDAAHPALFAISCHTNELGGELDEALRTQVLAGEASIPALTETLPDAVMQWLAANPPAADDVPTIALALDAAPGSLQSRLCRFARGMLGRLRALCATCRRAGGFLWESPGRLPVQAIEPPADSLLRAQLEHTHQHEDMVRIRLHDPALARIGAPRLLADLLDGFLRNPPSSVSRMMAMRNTLVRPLGLRTSTLGCPVSSLLSHRASETFDGRFPVLAQAADARHAQVILGADDKHLRFRSCVAVRIVDGVGIELSLGTRVHCKNLFGHIYIALIERVHRHHVSPAMLRLAAEHAFMRKAAHSMPLRVLPL